jgi:hypothetical protein
MATKKKTAPKRLIQRILTKIERDSIDNQFYRLVYKLDSLIGNKNINVQVVHNLKVFKRELLKAGKHKKGF